MLRKAPAALVIAAILLASIGLAAARRHDTTANPTDVASAARGALVSTTIKSPEEQVSFWRARVDANPTDYLSRTALGNSLLGLARARGDLDRYPEAEAVFAAALQLNPRHPAALLGLGAARGAQHDFAAQLALATQVLAAAPQDESARLAVADARLELGDVASASETYEAFEREARSAAISSRLAKTAWLRGDGTEAVRRAQEAIELSSALELTREDAAYYFFQLATFSYRTGDIGLARTSVDRALEIDPASLAALELAPQIAVAEGDLDRATRGYEELIAVSPAADLHGELAELYTAAGRVADAAVQVELGLSLGREQVGRYPAERRHLAGFFGTHDPALALRLAEEDIGTRRDVGALDTLAWALHQNGRDPEALTTIRAALETGIRDPVVLFHAGMIELASGHAAEARSALAGALDINPRFDVTDAPAAAATLASL